MPPPRPPDSAPAVPPRPTRKSRVHKSSNGKRDKYKTNGSNCCDTPPFARPPLTAAIGRAPPIEPPHVPPSLPAPAPPPPPAVMSALQTNTASMNFPPKQASHNNSRKNARISACRRCAGCCAIGNNRRVVDIDFNGIDAHIRCWIVTTDVTMRRR